MSIFLPPRNKLTVTVSPGRFLFSARFTSSGLETFIPSTGVNPSPPGIKPPHPRLRHVIPAFDPGGSSRPATRGGLHQQSFLRGKSQRFRKRFVNRDRLHSKKRLVHFAIGNQIVCDAFRGIDRNSEGNPR